MGRRRRALGWAAAILFSLVLFAQQRDVVFADATPSPKPRSATEQDAAIIAPLTEIGRVRARSPYCAALARARPGIDAAISFEYGLPVLAADIRSLRLDSALAKHATLKRAERDVGVLWDLAKYGRTEVLALRAAANDEATDEAKRREMLGFANALDGAKARQMELAKSVSRVVGFVYEQPVDSIVNSAAENHASLDYNNRTPTPGPDGLIRLRQPAGPAIPTPPHYESVQESGEVQRLFTAFADEHFIRDDLQTAARHAAAAMQLGGCSSF